MNYILTFTRPDEWVKLEKCKINDEIKKIINKVMSNLEWKDCLWI